MSWIDWLLDSTPFMDRWHCIRGDAVLGYWLLWANGVTALTYLSMGVPLLKVYLAHRETFGAAWFLAGFAGFIALCGVHHGFYDLAFRYAYYRLFAAVDVMMAVVSTMVGVAFYVKADDLCRARPLSEVQSERDEKDRVIEVLQRERREREGINLALINLANDLKRENAIYQTREERDFSHRRWLEKIEALADRLPGGLDHAGANPE